MTESRIGAIIATREDSSRIKHKALQPINKKPALEILINHLEKCRHPFKIVVATTKSSGHIMQLAKQLNVDYHVEFDNSPLHRLNLVAIKENLEHVIRVTHDDILIDPYLLEKQIQYHLKNKNDYTYMGRCPYGVAAEIISSKALSKIANRIKTPCEYISYYLKEKEFKYSEYYPPIEYQKRIRLSLDYPEDLKLLRLVYNLLGDDFGTLDAINLFKNNPHLADINKTPEVTFYTCNYNYSEYIGQCMDSVISQIDDFEYIIADDCSRDNSAEVILNKVGKYPQYIRDKLRIVRNSENRGLNETSNQCLNMAKGKYIMRVDSDDFLHPGKMVHFLSSLRYDNFDGVQSGYYRENNYHVSEHDHSGCCMFKTHIVQEYRYKNDINFAEGTRFLEAFKKDHKMKFLPMPLWHYRKHPNSKTA